MRQLFLAVEHMHKHKVIHRDLKPENILLDKDETLKISNFWFATVINDGELLTSESAFTDPFLLILYYRHFAISTLCNISILFHALM